MDKLERGIEFGFTVFPKAMAFFEPGKGAFNNPALGHDGEGVKFATFGNLHSRAKPLANALGKGLPGIATIHQHALNLLEVHGATVNGPKGSLPICDVGGGYTNGMRQPLGIDSDVAFNARYFLARIIAFFPGTIGVLHALRVHDQERRGGVAPLSHTGLANLIFLRTSPIRLFLVGWVGSTS